ncbi:hypothetical protein [Natrinema pallidum]|uniref:Uncharacterized protein n=1 Tax=Natrinema pallidum TaxID=69527 RepID=A0A4V1IER0_9EURY|nr:hypothetical protein [Natrinema pallidum]QCW02364.1 hypothetical protein FGF80_03555 [Natrinema pallidum]
MRRRDLLAGTTGAVCGLAGCTGSMFDHLRTTHPETDDTDAGTDSSDDTDRDAAESDSDDAITVGDPDEIPFLGAHPPHTLTLRNDGDSGRTVSVTITTDQRSGNDGADSGDGALLERDVDLPAGEEFVISLAEPRSYAITVTTGDDTTESTVTDGVSRRPFDCLRTRTIITLRGTDIETASSSTTIPCPDPDVVDASLAVGEGQCAGRTDRDRATVEFIDESVVIAGAIETPTPCHDLALAESTVDADRDLLVVTVAVGPQAAANCIDCLGIVGYDARIELEGRYPDTVAVRHERRDETRRLTTAESPASE